MKEKHYIDTDVIKMIIKGTVIIGLILLPLYSMNVAYRNSNYFLQLNDLYKFRIISDAEKSDIVNLGNSHEQYAIIYEGDFDNRGYNFALSSQPFEYSYYVLKYYSEYINDSAAVIIPISYFDWYYNYRVIFKEVNPEINNRYYSILDREHMYNWKRKDNFLYNLFPIVTAKKNMQYIWEDIEISQGYIDETMVGDRIDEIADYKYDSFANEVMDTSPDKKDNLKDRNKMYLKKIIDYCYENNYKPVLVSSPITAQLTSRFSKEFLEDFDNTCQEVLADYEELLYFDYSRDKDLANNLDYFRDADHLNTFGAEAYSKKLFKDLKKFGIIN